MEKNSDKQVRFGLRSIQETSFVAAEDSVLSSVIPVESLQFQYSTRTEISIPKNTIKVISFVKFFSGKVIYVELVVDFIFFVDDFDSIATYNGDSNEITFEPDLMPTFLGIVCGTMRGMLVEKVKNSSLSQYPIPLMGMDILKKYNTIAIV